MKRPDAGVALAWLAVLLAAAYALAAREYRTRDPDSVLYTQIVAQVSAQPLERWIAPRWPAGAYMQGLFQEHPAGLFVLPALLARAGYPAEQAAYVVNAVYQVLTLLLVPVLAARFAPERESARLAVLLQLLPVAFTYRIRANHEAAVLLCLLSALYGVERMRERAAWAALTGGSLVALSLVKGLVCVPAFLACALWLSLRGRAGLRPWLALAACALAVPGAAYAYEAAYRGATGESFLGYYLARAVRADAATDAAALDPLLNALWYSSRLAWFAFPWSILALAAAWGLRGRLRGWLREGGPARDGVLFGVFVSALYVGLFSLGARRAERYVFPAYYAIGALGSVAAARRWAGLGRALERLDGRFVPVAAWALLFTLHLFGGLLHLPRLRL